MCGIAGIISPDSSLVRLQRVQAMTEVLRHRGPDGEGYWQSDDGTIGFGHRRLAIIDVSAAGAQPFHYLHYVVVYNGEIYNYRELRDELKRYGYVFTTGTDTEVIPAAWDRWGVECLHRFDGMFAFALHDTLAGNTWVVRDRFGEKPLYYWTPYMHAGKPQQLVFASEIKALLAAGAPKAANQTMVLNYLALGYVQNPIIKTDTFYRNILNLPPGYLLEVQGPLQKFVMKRWYKPYERIGHQPAADEALVVDRFRELFFTSVSRRLRSDVPVGTSLSGGLDSSSIVAAIHSLKQGQQYEGWSNVVFTATFPGWEKDESRYANQVASHLGLRQYTVAPTAADMLQCWEACLWHQDEPVQSSSVITQYLVNKLAAQEDVTVLLDGQGADEILAGYKRYTPWFLQETLRQSRSHFRKEKHLLSVHRLLDGWSWRNTLAAWLPYQTAKLLQQRAWQQLNKAPLQPDFVAAWADKNTLLKPRVANLDDILYYNTFNFGLEELLRYADRNSMAHSREVRLPFLYWKLVEYVFTLPARLKIQDGFTKWLLRKTMEPLLPETIVWRRDKVGYEPPQAQWMQQPQVTEMIMESRRLLARNGILQSDWLDKPIDATGAHEAGNYDWRMLCVAAQMEEAL
jgi:asparagine synthase (glutamine-hydrolysing)